MGAPGQPYDPPGPKLTSERKAWLDEQIYAFLDEKNLLDCDLLRMRTGDHRDLQMWFVVYVLQHDTSREITIEILAEYLHYSEANALAKALRTVTGYRASTLREELAKPCETP